MITSHKWCDRCGKLVEVELITVELGVLNQVFEFCEGCFKSILENWEMQRVTVRALIEKHIKGDK